MSKLPLMKNPAINNIIAVNPYVITILGIWVIFVIAYNVPQAGERPNFYKIVSSNIKLNFLNLMISSNLLMGWRLLAVSVSMVIFFRFIGSINTPHQVYAISL